MPVSTAFAASNRSQTDRLRNTCRVARSGEVQHPVAQRLERGGDTRAHCLLGPAAAVSHAALVGR